MTNWVTPGQAMETLARMHDLSGRFGNFETCVQVAEETIMGRLAAGQLPTIASHVEHCPFEGFPFTTRGEPVPVKFWNEWMAARSVEREADWIVGDFRYSHGEDWTSEECWGKAFEVKFDAHALSWMRNDTNQSNTLPNKANGKGRGMAEWWPDFVAELVAYISEVGLPDGIGHQGQTLIYKEVSNRLALAGKADPERTTTQETINAVLRRMRQPENT